MFDINGLLEKQNISALLQKIRVFEKYFRKFIKAHPDTPINFRIMAVKMFILPLFDRLHFFFDNDEVDSYKFTLFRNTVSEMLDAKRTLTLEETAVVLGCSILPHRARLLAHSFTV